MKRSTLNFGRSIIPPKSVTLFLCSVAKCPGTPTNCYPSSYTSHSTYNPEPYIPNP